MRVINKTKIYALVLASYVLVALVFTYPLGINLNSHIPAYGKGGDAHSFVWNSWNFKKMLESGTKAPLTTSYLLIPFQPNLSFHTYTLFRNGLVFILSWFLPFLMSFNLVTLFMFVASAFGAYLLTQRFCRNTFAAFVSGVIFSFAPFKLARLMAHYNFVDSACLPFFVLFLFLALERKKTGYAVGAGLLLALIGYSSYYYLIFTLVFLTLFVLYSLLTDRAQALYRRPEIKTEPVKLPARIVILFQNRFFYQLGIIGLIWIVLFSPILVNIFKYQKEYLVEKKVFGKSPDLIQLVTPAPMSLLNRYVIKAEDYGTEKVIFVGFIAIILALYSLLLMRRKAFLPFWLGIAFIYIMLSLGPDLIIGGKRIIGLPYQILHSLPILSGARNPSRYIIFAMLSLGVLSACSLEDILQRVKKTRYHRMLIPVVSGLCLLLLCGEYLTAPLRMFDLKPHEFYRTIAADEDRCTVLEVPFSVSGKGKSFGLKERLGLYQYYQTVHQKDLASGWLANLPDKIFAYYLNKDFIQKICFLQERQGPVPDEVWTHLLKPDFQLKKYIQGFNIRYILIHRGAVKADAIANLTRYFSEQLSDFSDYTIREKDGIIRFTLMDEICAPPLGDNLLDPQNEVLLTEGWSNWMQIGDVSGRWGVTNKLVLLFTSPRQSDYELELDIEVPDFFQKKRQFMKVRLNSRKILGFEFTGRRMEKVKLPATALDVGTNVVTLELNNLERVKIDDNVHYRIGTTGVFSPVDIHAASLSRRLPFQGRIIFPGLWIGNPAERFPLQGGYNIFVVEETTGRVIDFCVFNTNVSAEAADKMAGYIDDIPAGRIVIALTWDDASLQLNDKAVQALRSVGSTEDIREHPVGCHAVIGIKGAAPGEALEQADPYNSTLVLGQFSNAEKVGLWFHRILLQKRQPE